MSSIKLSPNASGTGEFTIAAPNSNTNRTLTLPDQTGTVLTNAGPFTANASASNGAVTIDASNNVGIGTSSPTDTGSFGRALDVNGTTGAAVYARTNGSATQYAAIGSYGADGYVINRGAGILYFQNGGSNRAVIDAGGNLLVNTTSTINSTAGWIQVKYAGASKNGLATQTTDSTGYALTVYNSSATLVGSVYTNGSTTAFNTSSDYRLKENVQPLTGGLSRVAALKPCTYIWKADGSAGEGFIAHELAEIVPDAVTGEKDAVNEDGSIKPQGIDTSFLVATLTAAIQELKAEVDALKAQLGAQA